jgi:two-component system nitrogen regulation sensor histidine kinase NtrY
VSPRNRKTQLWLIFGGLLIALLLAAVFTLGSLDLPFQPRQWTEVLILYAVSTFIVSALLVFGLVLARTVLRLWAERHAHQPGARFKTKMVLAAMAISLLPVVTMFIFTYGLVSRTMERWFPRPLEIAVDESQKLLADFGRTQHERLSQLAEQVSMGEVSKNSRSPAYAALIYGADAAWRLDVAGNPLEVQVGTRSSGTAPDAVQTMDHPPVPRMIRMLPGGGELWNLGGVNYVAGRAVRNDGTLVVARRLPADFFQRFTSVETEMRTYSLQHQQYRVYKGQIYLVFSLFTLLLLFASTWFALFLSKQVTVPIQALAEGTREVMTGNFDYRVEAQAQDELATLVRSFNQMTAQLGESRRQIDDFTRNLQLAVQELERRRKVMEAIQENIPTGVLSLDDNGAILRSNSAVTKIFGERARTAQSLVDLMGEDAARGVQHLMRRSLRMGAASKELEVELPGRVLHAAVTVSSLGPRRSNPGFVVVVDDLTDLLHAQKASAWQEVAQRIAHEIKNPLTPIQLSAERLGRHLERQHAAGTKPADPDLTHLVGECSALIGREAAALKALVDEFSQFARFPTARLVSTDLNAIVTSALDIFAGQMDGVTVRTALAPNLPAIKADPELLRRVVVNLIDNAAEAMEGSAVRALAIATAPGTDGETVHIEVADSGHGISPEDKDKLFLPHFSTKDRGTGLGLAISGRIIAEHHGTIRVEDNTPVGARFVIELPVAEVPATPLPSES